MGQPATPKRKLKASDIVLYGVIVVAILAAFAVLGAAMDHATLPDGSASIDLLGPALSLVTSHPRLIFKALKNRDGFAPKMVFLGVTIIGVYALYMYASRKRLHRQGVEHGSAKWGDDFEKRALAEKEREPVSKPILRHDKDHPDGTRVFDDNGNLVCAKVDNNIILTKDVKLSLDAHQHMLNLNVLVIGGSGSGKTRFYALPNIMQMNTSYVVTDPKGEILEKTGKMLEDAGYKVRVFNTIEMEHSNNYNPFHYVYDYDGRVSETNIKKMVNVLFSATKGEGEKEDFWSQKGQSLLEAVIYLLFEESEYNAKRDANGNVIPETRDESHLNFYSVGEKLRRLQYPPSGKKDGYFIEWQPNETMDHYLARVEGKPPKKDDKGNMTGVEGGENAFLCPLDKDFIALHARKPNTLAERLYAEVRNAPQETGQSFISSANVKTFFFNMESVRNLTCCDNIHLETLGDEKTALFIIISATDASFNFLAAMMYSQLFDVLSNRANFLYGGVLPVHVRCIMDEFANIGQIPDFEKVIAFVRSMGMSLNVIIQNLAQLKSKYEKTWEIITGNCDSHLFLGGREESTLKYISESLNKETIDVKSANRTKGRQSSTSENNSILGRELMLPNEIASMPISDCIVLIRSHNPFYSAKYPLEDHPNYDLTKDNPYTIDHIHAVTSGEFAEAENKRLHALGIEEVKQPEKPKEPQAQAQTPAAQTSEPERSDTPVSEAAQSDIGKKIAAASKESVITSADDGMKMLKERRSSEEQLEDINEVIEHFGEMPEHRDSLPGVGDPDQETLPSQIPVTDLAENDDPGFHDPDAPDKKESVNSSFFAPGKTLHELSIAVRSKPQTPTPDMADRVVGVVTVLREHTPIPNMYMPPTAEDDFVSEFEAQA